MKRILLLSPFFFPEQISTGRYNTWLARTLLQKGADIYVIASHPLYPDWKPHYAHEEMEGIKVYRGGDRLHYPTNNILRRLLLELWFAWHVFRGILRLRWQREMPDIAVAIFPPNLFYLSCSMLLPEDVREVGIVHDLQGIYAKKKKGLLGKLLAGLIHFVEKKAFSRCDRLVFLSREMMEEAMREYGLEEEACYVIYPPVTLEASRRPNSLEAIFPEGYRHVVYSGALGEKQNPERLLELFHRASLTGDNVMFHCFSSGLFFDALRKKYLSLEAHIKFHSLVDEECLSELYSRSDVQIIPQLPGSSKGSLPSKLPNLLAAGVPVLAITEPSSELGALINKSGGIVVHEWTPGAFTSGLMRALDISNKFTHEDLRKRNEETILPDFSIDKLADIVGVSCDNR
ncbi:MAG TPA: glycosyltransferase [Nitrospirae bacterium]|nr:glycosyltransferase [Nitrospirota bacterium]